MVYADSSLLVSYYLNDVNSLRADQVLSSVSQPVALTQMHKLEITNGIIRAIFRNALTKQQARAVWKQMVSDRRAGRLAPTDIDLTAAFNEARRLSVAHTATLGTRSLDTLHVAAARRLGMTMFLTFDQKQAALARAVGLQVLP